MLDSQQDLRGTVPQRDDLQYGRMLDVSLFSLIDESNTSLLLGTQEGWAWRTG